MELNNFISNRNGSNMLIYDMLHKEAIYHTVISDLRNFGVKYRFKKNIFKTERVESVKNRKVFKTPLSYQPLDVVNLASGGIVHVPVFVSQAATFLEKNITQEGLFRKAGSQARQKELMARLDNGGTLGDRHHPADVANCLKTFFRDLPEPLIPYVYHDLFIHCAMLKNCHVQALLLACILLPPHHLNTLAFFMEFLKKVSTYEKQNRMSVDNLAKVVGPNVMPLQQATIAAVQTRLELHLIIVKVLIENADQIGVLPNHITQNISLETIDSTDNDLDLSDCQSRSKSRKTKHRSGSLTRKPHLSASNLNLRMFNGLRKMVGKSGLPEDNNLPDNQQVPVSRSTVSESNIKPGKKRKVAERVDPQSTKKKRAIDKTDKSKKLRLSLDRFVPKTKQKIPNGVSDLFINGSDGCTERRWSSASNSYDSQRKCKICKHGSPHLQLPLKDSETPNAEIDKEYNNMFIEADVNLSDDSDQVFFIKEDLGLKRGCAKLHSSSEDLKSSDDYDSMRLDASKEKLPLSNVGVYSTRIRSNSMVQTNGNEPDEYVKIPKSEYEDIKNRVFAIESRISQEFGRANDENDDLSGNSVNKVQTEYEKTLEEARIETTTDYLAKKLGKELKIRRSGEHRIIRSPSARKIGTLRRRSQEKVASKRVRRTASWHISPEFDIQPQVQPNLELNQIYQSGKKLTHSSNYPEDEVFLSPSSNSNWQEEDANIKLIDDFSKINNSEVPTMNRAKRVKEFGYSEQSSSSQPSKIPTHTSVRRVSSFHGNEIGKLTHFEKRLEKIKKTNSQQSILPDNICQQIKSNSKLDSRREPAPSWSDAAGYFKSSTQTTAAPVTQTGRASIAKLRTQNAGMVLAKAKLFDGTQTNGHNKKCDWPNENEHNKQVQGFKVCDIDSQKSSSILKRQKENSSIVRTPPLVKKVPINNFVRESRLSVYKSDAGVLCNTPHIKKPLTVKSPRSAKLVRRPAMDTHRTPLKALGHMGTPKYQSPRGILKTRNISRQV